VTLENALVRDQRLSLDEHGMLHYLLSLPHDWEVSRARCAKFWGIGREKAGRIFRNLRKTGWARVERIHGEDGTFLGTRWIITDEPGEQVADAVLDAEEDGEDEADTEGETETESVEAPRDHDTAKPHSGSTAVRENRHTGKPYRGDYIDSTKTDSYENRDSQKPAGARERDLPEGKPAATFSDLLKVWPPDKILSKVAAEQAWQHLGGDARQRVNACAPRYLDDCRTSSRKVCDLKTYIVERRDERFAPVGRSGSPPVAVNPRTPEWHRWREYRIAMGQSVSLMDAQASRGVGWTVPTPWPPPVPPELKPADQAKEGQQ
jgi:hypothetical protein